MKMIFNYDANTTHFHNKGFALSLVLKVRFFGTRKWPIENYIEKGPEIIFEEVETANVNESNYEPLSCWNIHATSQKAPRQESNHQLAE